MIGVPRGGRVLDFGCGRGGLVDALCERGADAVGCDFAVELDPDHPRTTEIELDPYRLPYDDSTFDLVVSDQVFEHVQNHDVGFAEIARVLKPGGQSIHYYPARWTPLEVHSLVPFAGVIQTRWWLSLWARLGVRNRFQQDLSAKETADKNYSFLQGETNYITGEEMLRLARQHFTAAEFREQETMAVSTGRARHLKSRPGVAVYRAFRAHVLWTGSPLRPLIARSVAYGVSEPQTASRSSENSAKRDMR